VAGELSLEKALAQFKERREVRGNSLAEQEASVPLDVELAVSLFAAGKTTEAEFIFYCAFPIVRLHEKYHLDGSYDGELKEISAKMERIEKSYGLKENEYWLIGDAPAEYLRESENYDSVLERKQLAIFRKFAPSSLLHLLESNPEKFWNLYEHGRRSVFEKDDHLASTIDLVYLYENEAQKSAGAEAYYAAITMLGSAAEARIVLECLRQPAKIRTIIRKLPKRRHPRSLNPLEWTLANLIDVATEAGWLPNIDDGDVVHVVSGWAHRLRIIRNLLHPGRHVLEKPHATIGIEEWQDALSAYTTLRHSIEIVRKERRRKKTK
jgi:hypothetical protein